MVLKKKRTLTYTGTVQCTIYTVRKKKQKDINDIDKGNYYYPVL